MPAIFSPSRADIAPCMAKTEGLIYSGADGVNYPLMSGNYGTDPTLAPASNGFYSTNSQNPITVQTNDTEINPHNATLSRTKDLIGQRWYQINVGGPLIGNTSGGSAPPFDALWKAGGLQGAVCASTATKYRYAPCSLKQQTSSTFACELDGKVHESNGVVGTLTISAQVGGECRWQFSGSGLYQVPQHGTFATVYSGTWSGGTDNSASWLGAAGTIRRAGYAMSATYSMVVQSFELALNCTVSRIDDANQTHGLKMFLVTDRNPRLTMTMAMDVDSAANVTYENIYADLMASTTHDVAFTYTDLGSHVFTFNFPKAQVKSPSLAVSDGVRTLSIPYKLSQASTAGDDEFSIVIS